MSDTCTCVKGYYCNQDNLHYPPETCDSCREKQFKLDHLIEKFSHNVYLLPDEIDAPVLPLKDDDMDYIDDLPF